MAKRRFKKGKKNMIVIRRKYHGGGRMTGFSIPNSIRTYNFKYQSVVPVVQAAGGVAGLSNWVSTFPINHPGYNRISAGNVYGAIGTTSTAGDALFNQFDKYKVIGMKVRFLPNEINTITNVATPDIVDACSVIYATLDLDDSVNITGESEALEAGSIQKSMQRSQRWYFKNRGEGYVWRNCQNITMTPSSVPTASVTPTISEFSSVKFIAPNLEHAAAGGADYYFGRLYITWFVIFKGIAVA